MAKLIEELRKADLDTVEERVQQLRREVMDLRFSHGTGSLEDPSRLAQSRRDVARALTVLRERRAEAAAETAPAASSAPAESSNETAEEAEA